MPPEAQRQLQTLKPSQAREIVAQQTREADARERHAEYVQALVDRVHKIRTDLEGGIAQLQETCLELRNACRRNYDEASSSYIIYANSHLRLAGALTQGVKRTASMDRVLVNAAREREEAKVREEAFRRQQEVRAHGKLIEKLQLPTPDDFDDLFGELVNDAAAE